MIVETLGMNYSNKIRKNAEMKKCKAKNEEIKSIDAER